LQVDPKIFPLGQQQLVLKDGLVDQIRLEKHQIFQKWMVLSELQTMLQYLALPELLVIHL
jgi:hypothetical protein